MVQVTCARRIALRIAAVALTVAALVGAFEFWVLSPAHALRELASGRDIGVAAITVATARGSAHLSPDERNRLVRAITQRSEWNAGVCEGGDSRRHGEPRRVEAVLVGEAVQA